MEKGVEVEEDAPGVLDCRMSPVVQSFRLEVPAGGDEYRVVDEGHTVAVYGPDGGLVGEASGLRDGKRRPSWKTARKWAFEILAGNGVVGVVRETEKESP